MDKQELKSESVSVISFISDSTLLRLVAFFDVPNSSADKEPGGGVLSSNDKLCLFAKSAKKESSED